MKCVERSCAREAVAGSYCAVHAPKLQFLPGHSPTFGNADARSQPPSAAVGNPDARSDDALQRPSANADGRGDRTG